MSSLKGLLVGVSTSLALATRTEELQLGENETEQWLKYAQAYARHYNVATNQKAVDAIVFYGFTTSMIATRVIAARRRTSKDREQRQQASVTAFRGRNFTVHEPEPTEPPIIAPDFSSDLGGDDVA